MAAQFSTFLIVLQIIFFYTEALPTGAIIEMPEDCKNQTYCINDTNYPHADVEYLLKNENMLSFRIDMISSDHIFTGIGNRQGTDDDYEIYPCPAEYEERKEIRYIVDEQDNVRVVAQAANRFMQYVPIIKCKSSKPTKESNMVLVDLGDFYDKIIRCEENRLNFNFVVLSHDFKKLEMARVKGGVPVGCQCRYVQ